MWQFFADMTSQSLGSIVSRGELIRKIRIPRWIIVLSSSFSALINLGLNIIVVSGFLFLNDVQFLNSSLWFPLILIEVYIFALGLSFFLAAAFVKYRDISYIWEVVLQAGFYATPILYTLSQIPNPTFQKILMLNPMAQAIQDARYSIITHQSPTIFRLFDNSFLIAVPFMVVILAFIVGLLYFKKESKYFAENL